MATRQALLVDAFTDEPTTGNPAGLLPEAAGLTDDQCRAVASELGASETAFVEPSERADRRLRFFSAEAEVDLCGHAAIAAHAALFERGAIEAGTHDVETGAGVLDVEVEEDGTVWLDAPAPEIRRVDATHEDVAAALGIDVASLRDVGADLPLSRATSGQSFLLVPVNYFEHLSDVDADLGAIADLCVAADADGLYAFTFDTLDGAATAHGRAFVPGAGRPEDPVTGTAAGALAAYLRRHAALDGERDEIVVEQGHFLDRPGQVRVRTDGREVSVGGRAVTALDGNLVVPEPDDDEIIEAE